jgi:hypothetical protein
MVLSKKHTEQEEIGHQNGLILKTYRTKRGWTSDWSYLKNIQNKKRLDIRMVLS